MSNTRSGHGLWAALWTVLFGITLAALYCVAQAEDINPTNLVVALTLTGAGAFWAAFTRARIVFGDQDASAWLRRSGYRVEFFSAILSALPIALFVGLGAYPGTMVFLALALGALPLIDHYWPELQQQSERGSPPAEDDTLPGAKEEAPPDEEDPTPAD